MNCFFIGDSEENLTVFFYFNSGVHENFITCRYPSSWILNPSSWILNPSSRSLQSNCAFYSNADSTSEKFLFGSQNFLYPRRHLALRGVKDPFKYKRFWNFFHHSFYCIIYFIYSNSELFQDDLYVQFIVRKNHIKKKKFIIEILSSTK